MCGPDVMQVVKDRVAREGKPRMSRRNFLRLGGVAAAGVAATVLPAGNGRVQAARGMGGVVDLSHVFGTGAPTYPAFNAPHRGSVYTVEANGFYAQMWSFAEHTGTHIDAPGHFIAGGELVDAIPPDRFVGPAVVIDIAARAEEDADTQVTPDDLAAWESENGEIPPGAIVFMHSGWEARFGDVAAFRNFGDDGAMHFPGFHVEAAQMLVEERDIMGIGVDTLSLDLGSSATYDTHYAILGAGLWGLENVANLTAIKGAGATVVVGVPRFEQGSGGPCRVLALLP